MKLPTDNYKKKKIIFNNRFLKSIKMNSESFRNSNVQPPIENQNQNIPPPLNNSNLSDDEIEINISLDNGENIKHKFYLNENIYNEVEKFCKKNTISEEGEDLILQQIDSKIAELIQQIKKNILKNKKNEIVKQNTINTNKSKITGDEIGQRLYEKGMKFKLKKEINIQIMKTQLKPKYDFRPHLSKKTLELTKNLYNKNTKIEDRLLSLGNEHKKNLLKKIAEKKFLEDNENITISKSSRSKSNNKKYNLRKSKSEDVLTKKKEKNKKDLFEELYPFKPKITKKAKNMKREEYDNIIKKYNDKYKHKNDLINQEQKNNNIKNISSKINLYNKKPKNFINRNIKEINSIKKKQINYGLYSLENSKNNFNEEDLKKQKKNIFEINANNKLNQIKDYKFKEIFDLLDNNKQGYLSYSNINFINIDQKILNAVSPVICQINENKNKKIYFNEFKKLVNKPLTDIILK